MQRRIGLLIDKIRKRTGNSGSSSNVTDDEIIDSLNDAQERLIELIVGSFGTRMLRKTHTFQLSSSNYEYDLPVDLFDDGFIENVQFTTNPNPQEQSWTRLSAISLVLSELPSFTINISQEYIFFNVLR